MPDSLKQPFGTCLPLVSEQINVMQVVERPAGADIQIRDSAIIEADRKDIRALRGPLAKLLDGEQQLISLR
jgi:hypothetical protein